MQRLSLALLGVILLAACGDDKGGEAGSASETSNPTATPADTGEATMATPTSGEAGTTGGGPPPGPPVCQEACGSDADCTMFMADNGYKCVRERCGPGCDDDMTCVAKFSYWAVDCNGPGTCPNQVCVDIGGGQGKCAAPSATNDCAVSNQKAVMLPTVGGGMESVCATTLYKCDGGLCDSQCASDEDCLTPGLGRCDTGTGQCVCVDDAGCMAANLSTPRCSPLGFCGCGSDENCSGSQFLATCMPDGTCGCKTDADCVSAFVGDTCTDGKCGCSGAEACGVVSKSFDGTEFVCE